MRDLHIFIFGHYGRKNAGDDAMIYALLELLDEAYPFATFSVPSSISLVLPSKVQGRTTFVPRRAAAILCEIMRSQVVILGGGTLFHDHGGRLYFVWVLLRLLAVVLWSKLWRKRVYLIGVGFGPFETRWGYFLTRNISRMADFISVRDQDSLSILRGLGVSSKRVIHAFDLAVLLPIIVNRAQEQRRFILGISVLPYFTIYHGDIKNDYRMIERIAVGVNKWLLEEPLGEVHLITIRGERSWGGDVEITECLATQLNPRDRVRLISYSPDPSRMLCHVAQCDAFVAMRFHSAIFAYMCQLPMIVINYHPKCRALAREIGLPDQAVISVEDLMKGELDKLLLQLHHTPDAFRARLPVEEARRKAMACLSPQLRGTNARNGCCTR